MGRTWTLFLRRGRGRKRKEEGTSLQTWLSKLIVLSSRHYTQPLLQHTSKNLGHIFTIWLHLATLDTWQCEERCVKYDNLLDEISYSSVNWSLYWKDNGKKSRNCSPDDRYEYVIYDIFNSHDVLGLKYVQTILFCFKNLKQLVLVLYYVHIGIAKYPNKCVCLAVWWIDWGIEEAALNTPLVAML